jgi:hypothetical protein
MHRTRVRWILFWILVYALSQLAGQQFPAAAGSDIQIDLDITGPSPPYVQNETSLVQNPTNPQNLLVTYNDNPWSGSPFGLGYSYTTDRGQNWTAGQLPVITGTNPTDHFDPISAGDNLGNLYAGYISTEGLGNNSGLYVHRSTDGGATWSGAVPVSTDRPASGSPDPNYRFNDKPHLAADTVSGTFANRLYATWIKDRGFNTGPNSDIYFSWSPDQGSTWNYPGGAASAVEINDNPGTDLANGPNAAVASDGTVYVAWLDVDVTNPSSKPGTLMFDSSTDGGTSFGTDVAVRAIRSLPNQLSTAGGSGDDARARSYPAIAVSPTNPQEVYLTYAEDPDYNPGTGVDGPDEADVFFLKSTDGGSTWSLPVRVNNDGTTTDQFEPWVAVKPDGTIEIAWYDKRNDPANDSFWDVYLARSFNGGSSFSQNIRVSDASFAAPNTAGGVWFGEYLGLAADNQYSYVAFSSSVNDLANGDVFFDSLFIPEPGTMTLLFFAGLAALLRRRTA